eukprot:TRINITY_DN7429_c0_g1_i2.p1 TRINITY_DN7429_c0_g1~~TRINITY_DN7429_c0_g1_i2.p1  ORF type:complete len:173 (+),score=30.54 TRINITY_DN7429_c0_g1_i2:246-764(+)
MSNNTIRVENVKHQGLVPDWNKSRHILDVHIMTGDIIVSVNGCFGDVELMKKQLKEQTVTLAVRRPTGSWKREVAAQGITVRDVRRAASAGKAVRFAPADEDIDVLDTGAAKTLPHLPLSRLRDTLAQKKGATCKSDVLVRPLFCESLEVREEEDTAVDDIAGAKPCRGWCC